MHASRLLAFISVLVGLVVLPAARSAEAPLVYPDADWEQVKPESAGYSSAKLDVLRAWLKTQKTTGLQVTIRGREIFRYGDLGRVSKVASVRKSVLAMLYGNYVESGRADLNQTVVQLGLGDVEPFLPIEQQATLIQLLTARSGIYHPTANRELTDQSPRRGTQSPGTYFQYQNWDFNAAGTAFERISGRDLFVALEEDLAKPLHMQDFDRAKQRKNSELPISRHPEYAMYLSTRDMSRLGLLMLADGRWKGAQVLPKGWARRITTLVTHSNELHPLGAGAYQTQIGRWGYGMLWWVWDAPAWPGTMTGPYQGAYTAIGANGQYITVLPAMGLVMAHKVDFDQDPTRSISPSEFHTILQMVIDSGCSEGCQ